MKLIVHKYNLVDAIEGIAEDEIVDVIDINDIRTIASDSLPLVRDNGILISLKNDDFRSYYDARDYHYYITFE